MIIFSNNFGIPGVKAKNLYNKEQFLKKFTNFELRHEMKFDGKPIACMCKINIWIYRALSKHLFEVQDDALS